MTLTFEQLNKDTRYTQSEKSWYKHYPFRLSMEGWWLFNDERNSFATRVPFLREVRNFCAENDMKCRNDSRFQIYCKTLRDVTKVLSRWDEEIIQICGPISQSHHDMILDNLNVVVRDRLYYKDFRYKISSYLYRNEMHNFTDMKSFVVDNFEHDDYKMNPMIKNYDRNLELETKLSQSSSFGSFAWRRRFLPYSGTGTVYFKNYEDMIAYKFAFNEWITDSKKVVLKSEIR